MNQGALHFDALLSVNNFDAGITRIKNSIREASGVAKKEAQEMDNSFRALGTAIGGYFTAQSLFSFTKELINVRGEFQKTEIAFSTMLGSGDKAKVLMGQMVDLAAKTPFDLKEVSSGAKQLLAFQVPANEVVDTLTRMGNIAAGLSVPISRINLVFGQVKAKGRLMGDDLRQFTEAGIPMVAELAKKFNKTTAEISDMVSAGKIGFNDVKEVLFAMTNEGGMFFNLMEKQSTSLSGRIANLGDNWQQMLNKIGESNEGALYGGIEALNYLIENYQQVLNTIESLIVVYGSYRAALIVTSAAQNFANKTVQSEIALLSISEKMKLGRAMVTQRQAEATAREAAAEVENVKAKFAALRAENAVLIAKKESLRQAGLTTMAKWQEARLQLRLAQLELSSMQATGTAREVEIAQKRVTIAQNAVLSTQATATIAKNAAVANSVAIWTNKEILKNTTQAIGAAQGAATVASEAAQTAAKNANAIATTRLTIATRLRTAATQLATAAQAILNATMLNNPIVIVIAAAAALTYAYFRLRDTSTALTIAEKLLNDEREKSTKLIDDLKNKTQELTAVINSDTSTKLQQYEAYKQMQSMYPDMLKDMDVETFKKLGATEAQKKLNAEIDKFSTLNLKKQIENSNKSIDDLNVKIAELNERLKKRDGDSGIYLNELELAKKNLEAQKINLEKYNAEYRQRLENEKISSMSLEQQKKYWEDQIISISNQISGLEKSNSKKAEGIDKLNNMNSLIKTTSVNLLNWNISPLLSQLERARNEVFKINNVSNPNIDKNKAFWEQQRKAAEDLVATMTTSQKGTPAWNEAAKKWKEADEQLKKYDLSDRQLLKDEKARAAERKRLDKGAEKAFLQGSLKSYDQKINLYEEALSRSNGDTVKLRYFDKYGKERNSEEVRSVKSVQDELVKLREDRAEREKLIEIKSFQERIDESERQWNNYYKMSEFYGKETADAQYKELFNGAQNYLEYLKKQEQVLRAKQTTGLLTEKDKKDIVFLQQKITELNGTETPFENFKRGIDDALKALPSFVDQLDVIEKASYEAFKNAEYTDSDQYLLQKKFLKDKNREILQQQKDSFTEFLKEEENFQKKQTDTIAKWDDIRKKLQEKADMSPEEKVRYNKVADKKSKEEISQLAVDELTQSQAWLALYGNIDELTVYQMDVLLRELEAKKTNLSRVLTPIDFKILLKNFRDVKNKINEGNPFMGLFNSIKEVFEAIRSDSKETGDVALSSFERASEGIKGTISASKGIIGALTPAREYMSDTANAALDTIEQVVTMGMGMMQAIDGTVKAVSSAIKSATWSNWITALIQIIYTAIRAIVSLFTWIAGNKTKKINKEIKEYQAVLNGLEQSYNDLAIAAEKAYGSMKYEVQRESIKNLQEQQKALEEMKNAESKKKKADQSKIDSYNDQQQENIRKIEELKNEIIRDVLQTDVREMSSKIGDALIEAFGKGLDGIDSINKAFDDMVRNIMRNQLNKVLEKQFAPVYDNILKAAGFDSDGNGNFNGFSASEMADLRAQVLAASDKGKEFINAWSELFTDLDMTSPESLKGDIKGITEKTAGALEAQFNAVRINIVAILKIHQANQNVFKNQLLVQSQIEINTRPLKAILKEITELNSKVKKSLAGVP